MRSQEPILRPKPILRGPDPSVMPAGPAVELADGTYACVTWLEGPLHSAVIKHHNLKDDDILRYGAINAGRFKEN